MDVSCVSHFSSPYLCLPGRVCKLRFQVNLLGQIWVLREFLPAMIKMNRWVCFRLLGHGGGGMVGYAQVGKWVGEPDQICPPAMIGLDRLILEVAHPAMLHIPGANINQHEPVSLKTMLDNFDSVMRTQTMIMIATLLEGHLTLFLRGSIIFMCGLPGHAGAPYMQTRDSNKFLISLPICTQF